MKKKVLFFTVMFLAVFMLFNSCKKYEEGPLLSLRSKNARLTGEWVLKEYKYIRTTNEGSTTRTLNGSVMTYSGKVYNYYYNEYVDTTYTYTYSLNFTVEKDGTYKWVEIEEGEADDLTSYWSWLDGKSGKEQILLYENGLFIIKRLTNKELIFEENYYNSYTYNGNNSFDTCESVWTFEKK